MVSPGRENDLGIAQDDENAVVGLACHIAIVLWTAVSVFVLVLPVFKLGERQSMHVTGMSPVLVNQEGFDGPWPNRKRGQEAQGHSAARYLLRNRVQGQSPSSHRR